MIILKEILWLWSIDMNAAIDELENLKSNVV